MKSIPKETFMKAVDTVIHYCTQCGIACANQTCPAYDDEAADCMFNTLGEHGITPNDWIMVDGKLRWKTLVEHERME